MNNIIAFLIGLLGFPIIEKLIKLIFPHKKNNKLTPNEYFKYIGLSSQNNAPSLDDVVNHLKEHNIPIKFVLSNYIGD